MFDREPDTGQQITSSDYAEDTNEVSSVTAFPQSEAYLRDILSDSDYDASAFEMPLSRCASCKGMCCYHGAHLNDEEAAFVSAVAEQEADYFEQLGLELPQEVVVEGEWRGKPSGKKTAVKQWDYRERLPWFPAHWDNTACVFLTREGYCGLQLYSRDCGLHKWFAKPLTCWLHPINFPDEGGITVYGPDNDPTIYSDYPGFNTVTHCGKPQPSGTPAYQVLKEELDFLGQIVGKNFYHEIDNKLNSCK